MFTQLVVPVDLSPASFEAVPIAARLAAAAHRLEGAVGVTVTTVVERLGDVEPALETLAWAVRRMGRLPVAPELTVDAGRSPAAAIARRLEQQPGALALMRSHGHGRSAAVLGSTTDELLRTMFGPVIVVGPRATVAPGELDGRYIVPLDGSARADIVLPLAAAWARRYDAKPELVEVIDGTARTDEIAAASRLGSRARQIATRIGASAPAGIEVVHDRRVGRAIVSFAQRREASLIFLATHGRTGIERLRSGSVAADVVRQATCPVVLFRPPADEHGAPEFGDRLVAIGAGEARTG